MSDEPGKCGIQPLQSLPPEAGAVTQPTEESLTALATKRIPGARNFPVPLSRDGFHRLMRTTSSE
jgi:hypothetical protein